MKLIVAAILLLVSFYVIVFWPEIFCSFFDNKLGCYSSNLELQRGLFGMDKAKAQLVSLYDEGRLSQGQCHSLGHEMGRAGVQADKTIVEDSMSDENSFCGWGYYHGVMEGLFGDKANHGTLTEDAVRICREISGNFIDVFNCFHSLGHGFYFADKDLNDGLSRCLSAGENDMDKGYCIDGVFMANSFFAETENKYFKKDNPLFPCDIVDDIHKPYCYWRSLPLNIFGQTESLPDYGYISLMGDKVPEEFKLVFWNGVGREFDSRTASDAGEIFELCSKADNPRTQRAEQSSYDGGAYAFSCIVGAGRHMVFYDKGKTERAERLCYLLAGEKDRAECTSLVRISSYPGLNNVVHPILDGTSI